MTETDKARLHKAPLRCLCALKGRSPLYPPKSSRAAKTTGKKMQSENRTRSIKIRLTDNELEALNRKKTRPELARWIRETALATEPPKPRKKNSDYPPELARILAGMGNNLNQIAKQLNTAAKIGTLGNLEAVRAITEIAATERSLNALREYLANKSKETEK